MADIRISAERLRGFAEALLAAGGFTREEAKAMADSLTLAELMGHGSHGLMRVKEYLEYLRNGDLASGTELRVIKETPASLTADASLRVGQAVMPKLLEKMYGKLATQAVVSAAVSNCGHVGRIGEWVEKAAYKGYAALLLVNDNGTFFAVAPPGVKKGMTSTNPLAFAVPLPEGKIFAADMSTSAVAFGKVKLARLTGTQMPPGCIQDAEGRPTTDPEALFADPPGAIRPMGGAQDYKGFALSMFVDMLGSGLSGGQTPPAQAGTGQGNSLLLVLWNPEFFAGDAHLRNQAAKYIEFLRTGPPVDPEKPLRLAGDRMNALKEERLAKGIPVGTDLARQLLKLAGELGVAPPSELTG